MKAIFFLGKGGVGKTTLSASCAFYISEIRKKHVIWVSIDPAHNISDFVGRKVHDKLKISENLYAVEVNVDKFVKDFLKDITDKMKRMYKHLKIAGIENIFDTMKLSPGVEENAILYAIYDIIEKYKTNTDYIIFDTPPTGLTLRIIALIEINLKWLFALKKWRINIIEHRKAVYNIRKIEYDLEDNVLKELNSHIEKMKYLQNIILNKSRSRFILVMNQDRLSFSESLIIKNTLNKLDLSLDMVLVNKFGMLDTSDISHIRKAFDREKIVTLPFIENKDILSKTDLINIAALWVDNIL